MDFRILDSIEEITPTRIAVKVWAAQEPPLVYERTVVKYDEASSHDEALKSRDRLKLTLAEEIHP